MEKMTISIIKNQKPRSKTKDQRPKTKNQKPKIKNQKSKTKNQKPKTKDQRPMIQNNEISYPASLSTFNMQRKNAGGTPLNH